MNHEMMPEFGDSWQSERTANSELGGESDQAKELSTEQINKLCLKIIDAVGGVGNTIEYIKGGLYLEVACYCELDDDDQVYETVYSVVERRQDQTRDDGRFYNTKVYSIILDDDMIPDSEYAQVESRYEFYNPTTSQIEPVEQPLSAEAPEVRLQQAIDSYDDAKLLGVNRPLNQQDYTAIEKLLNLPQR